MLVALGVDLAQEHRRIWVDGTQVQRLGVVLRRVFDKVAEAALGLDQRLDELLQQVVELDARRAGLAPVALGGLAALVLQELAKLLLVLLLVETVGPLLVDDQLLRPRLRLLLLDLRTRREEERPRSVC